MSVCIIVCFLSVFDRLFFYSSLAKKFNKFENFSTLFDSIGINLFVRWRKNSSLKLNQFSYQAGIFFLIFLIKK